MNIHELIKLVTSQPDPDDPTNLVERPLDLEWVEKTARELGFEVSYWENFGDEIAVSGGYSKTCNFAEVYEHPEDGPVLELTWL